VSKIDEAIALVESEGKNYSHEYKNCVLNKLYGQFESPAKVEVAKLFSKDTGIPLKIAENFFYGCFPQVDKKFVGWEEAEKRDGSIGPQVLEVLKYLKKKYE
jgi:hypothetical protein